MKKVYLTVLYKTVYSDSQTLRSFAELHFGKNKNNFFVVWDNSPESETILYDLKCFLQTENVAYIHTPENTALSKIYNTCMDTYSDFDFMVLFDQDSKIIRADFDLYLEKIVSKNPDVPVFLPQIYSGDKLYSPGKFWVFKGWHYKRLSAGLHSDRLYTAIMSGTCASISFLKKHGIRFNEELSLYGIDTCFFCDVRKIDSHFYVLGERLEHNLSEMKLDNSNKKQRTFYYLEACKKTARKNSFFIALISLYEFFLRIIGRM